MPSSAVSSVNTIVRISSATTSAKTITGATAANPVVITSTSHSLANGTVIQIDGIVGMRELNGRAFVIANQATNSFELKGVDGTGYTAYTSGGTATPQTMVEVGNIRNATLFQGTTPEIDVTNLRSLSKEYVLDVPDRGAGSFTMDIDTTDPGQAALKAAHLSIASRVFTVTDRNGKSCAFVGYVQSFPVSIGVGQPIQGTVAIRTTSLESWFA
jgi:hypothetical protein